MFSLRPWLICLTSKSAFLCCLLIALVGSPADVSAKWKWKDVSADEAVLKLKGWPTPVDQCRIRIGTPPDFHKEHTVFFCPRWVGSDEPRTYFRLIEMMPGWRWGWSYGVEFSEQPMFTKWKGNWVTYFRNPVIKPGQKTKCYNDAECYFQRVEFTVKGQECQWIINIPDLKYSAQARSEAPYGVEIYTCQTSVPITEKHIEMKPGKVTVTFPGVGNTESASEADSDAANNKTRLEQKCLYGDTNACKLLNSLTSKPKATENDCPDGSIDNGKGECLVHRKEANTADGSNPPTKNVETQTAMKPAPSSGSTTEKRSIAVQWEGKDSLLAGHITIPKSGAGNITFSVPETGGKCSGTFVYTNPKKGIWSAACTTGETASGSFKALGAGRGSTGTGKDNEGRTVRFTIGAK